MLYDLLVYDHLERQNYRYRKQVSGYYWLGMQRRGSLQRAGGNFLGAGIVSSHVSQLVEMNNGRSKFYYI